MYIDDNIIVDVVVGSLLYLMIATYSISQPFFEIGTFVPISLPASRRLPPNRYFGTDCLLAAKLGSSRMFFLQKTWSPSTQ